MPLFDRITNREVYPFKRRIVIMDLQDLSTYSKQEASQIFLSYSPEDLTSLIPSLTPEQVGAITLLLHAHHESHWREKLTLLIENLKETKSLEAVGRNLSLTQALHLLDEFSKKEQGHLWKLSPLLVGMSHRLFSQILISTSQQHIQTLKQEVMAEPLQHHLTVTVHEITHQIPEFLVRLNTLEREIESIKASEIGHIELKTLTHKIEDEMRCYDEIITKINKSLMLVWNTNRTDLIEKFSAAKEILQKLINKVVGVRRSKTHEASGLFAKLEEHLNCVYGKIEDPQDIEALEDDDPALEALTKLSLWYLRDYWEIGLLPHIASPEELEFENALLLDEERLGSRDKNYQEVIKNLSKIGLHDVKDLKEAKIFSKVSLSEYIKKNQHFLR